MRKTTYFLIIGFWLLTTAWLIRYEAFPGYFSVLSPGYHKLLPKGPLINDSWMKITMMGMPMGYSHTTLDTLTDHETDKYVLDNVTMLTMNMFGAQSKMKMTLNATLDAFYKLRHFSFSTFTKQSELTLKGVRDEGEMFAIRLKTRAGEEKMRMRIPNEGIFYWAMTEFDMKTLRPGTKFRIKMFNPMTMSMSDILLHAVHKEEITISGKSQEATLITAEYEGAVLRSWLDASGRLLRQETPFGWTMESCTMLEAFASFKSRIGPNMLEISAIPLIGQIPNPRKCKVLRLDLLGRGLTDELVLDTKRQKIEQREPNKVRILSRMIDWPAQTIAIGEHPPELTADLQATMFIQSSHEEMRSRAREILGDCQDAGEAARLLCDWVYHNVKKNPAINLPSAIDVLRNLEGDCNEHTYLTVGLARAVGIPAKIMVGIVYMKGALYYHAWPALYVGEWLEMDPTFNQHTVDATHIALLEGELESQMKLMSILGQFKAVVIKEEERHDQH